MAYKQTYNPCDDCQYSYSKNGQESNMCKVCEFRQLLDKPTADVAPKSEVAREIFEKFIIISESPYRIHIIVEKEEFDELKKKYGVTDKNVGRENTEEKE